MQFASFVRASTHILKSVREDNGDGGMCSTYVNVTAEAESRLTMTVKGIYSIRYVLSFSFLSVSFFLPSFILFYHKNLHFLLEGFWIINKMFCVSVD